MSTKRTQLSKKISVQKQRKHEQLMREAMEKMATLAETAGDQVMLAGGLTLIMESQLNVIAEILNNTNPMEAFMAAGYTMDSMNKLYCAWGEELVRIQKKDHDRLVKQDEELAALRAKVAKLQQGSDQCCLCFEDKQVGVFRPCGHTCCYECGVSLSHCPICRKVAVSCTKLHPTPYVEDDGTLVT